MGQLCPLLRVDYEACVHIFATVSFINFSSNRNDEVTEKNVYPYTYRSNKFLKECYRQDERNLDIHTSR